MATHGRGSAGESRRSARPLNLAPNRLVLICVSCKVFVAQLMSLRPTYTQVTRTGKVMRPGQAPARPPVAPQHFASAPSPGRYASSNASVSSPPKASTVHSPSKATAVGESRLSPRGGEAKGAAAGAVPARLRTGSYNLRSGLSKASGTAAQGDSSVVLQVKSPTKGSPVKAMNRAITASPRA